MAEPRPPPQENRPLWDLFQRRKASGSDICEHMDLLCRLAGKCDHVTEMGMRGADGSTVALLSGQPGQLVSWDIDPFSVVSQPVANLLMMAGRTRFQPRCGDTLAIQIEPTDLLFIDTLHTARQLKAELERHGERVRKWIVMHDTATFGEVGEDGGQGLRIAIRWFQKEHLFPLWKLKRDPDGTLYDLKNCNGLVVLEHVSVPDNE